MVKNTLSSNFLPLDGVGLAIAEEEELTVKKVFGGLGAGEAVGVGLFDGRVGLAADTNGEHSFGWDSVVGVDSLTGLVGQSDSEAAGLG